MPSWVGRVSLGVLLVGTLVACSPSLPTPTSDDRATVTCTDPVTGPLPEWARAGFTPPDQPVAHLFSESGNLVAVPFGWPLSEHQSSGRQSKVLWIARDDGGGPLVIEARREGNGAVERRELPGGPGPSIVDLPEGCWRLELSWPGVQDVVYLRYLAEA